MKAVGGLCGNSIQTASKLPPAASYPGRWSLHPRQAGLGLLKWKQQCSVAVSGVETLLLLAAVTCKMDSSPFWEPQLAFS